MKSSTEEVDEVSVVVASCHKIDERNHSLDCAEPIALERKVALAEQERVRESDGCDQLVTADDVDAITCRRLDSNHCSDELKPFKDGRPEMRRSSDKT